MMKTPSQIAQDQMPDLTASQPQLDFLMAGLTPAAQSLFQARKFGVLVHVPESIRSLLLERHGGAASEVLDLLDGKVKL